MGGAAGRRAKAPGVAAVAAAALLGGGVPAGCGGGGQGARATVDFATGPWDAAIAEPAKPAVEARWAEGAVLDVDDAGAKFRVRIARGTPLVGDPVEVSTPPDEDPARLILPGGMRGMRVLAGVVTKVEGDVLTAEVIAGTRACPVQPGDRAVVRKP
jgi:hypothetical protein